MTFPFDISINLRQAGIAGIQDPTIRIYGGLTTFLGPNGAGKTQLLRGLKYSLSAYLNDKKIRYVSAGRLAPMENYRSDFEPYKKAIEEVKKQHLANLKGYALNAAQKNSNRFERINPTFLEYMGVSNC